MREEKKEKKDAKTKYQRRDEGDAEERDGSEMG